MTSRVITVPLMTQNVITNNHDTACRHLNFSVMSRWEPGARERLERAALELFLEKGFAETTVPEITARAGMTTRTFFRHYADKREVLFKGDDEISSTIATLMTAAPGDLNLRELIAWGLETMATTAFDGQFEYMRNRRAVVETDERLRERELLKRDAMASALARDLRDRGIDDLTATLAGKIAIAVFSTAVERWLDLDGERPLVDIVREALKVSARVNEVSRR